MNIAKILKDCPKGTKLYSLVHGECELLHVECYSSVTYPIIINVGDGEYSFTKDGLMYAEYINAECVLFPSKENRDWSTFKIDKEHQFKPFDKVLVRDKDSSYWYIDLFSHIDYNPKSLRYVCLVGSYNQCIPYEANEHLLNTTNNPE